MDTFDGTVVTTIALVVGSLLAFLAYDLWKPNHYKPYPQPEWKPRTFAPPNSVVPPVIYRRVVEPEPPLPPPGVEPLNSFRKKDL